MWSPAAPHFLFNVLTTVQTHVRERPELAEAMIGVLARFVRASLRGGERPVRLTEELALVGLYLGLERARLGFRLRTVLDVDPAALAVHVPSLVVQPLVENAVLHGAARRVEGATLRLAVRYRPDAGRLLIMVADDGPGLPRSRPGVGLPPDSLAGGHHLGLRILRRRLESAYGGGARLRLLLRPGGGTIAALTLPVRSPPQPGAVSSHDAGPDRR